MFSLSPANVMRPFSFRTGPGNLLAPLFGEKLLPVVFWRFNGGGELVELVLSVLMSSSRRLPDVPGLPVIAERAPKAEDENNVCGIVAASLSKSLSASVKTVVFVGLRLSSRAMSSMSDAAADLEGDPRRNLAIRSSWSPVLGRVVAKS